MATLTADQVRALDPYAFLAVLGKRDIHHGGRRSTDRLLEWAAVRPGEQVGDIGCGSPPPHHVWRRRPTLTPALRVCAPRPARST